MANENVVITGWVRFFEPFETQRREATKAFLIKPFGYAEGLFYLRPRLISARLLELGIRVSKDE